ncbi:hypothetical protein [Xylanimonas sp. McL0601]|uniref:hypothetical protein n=1 Tax=Xylanimonas sp. McL0601 TaxID=3414739 RepID=UPI003CECB010
MPMEDDAFVQALSRLAAEAAPTIDVDTTRVVPTARRRRDRRRSVATASLGVLVLAGVGFTQVPGWTDGPVVAAYETVVEPTARVAPLSVVEHDTDDADDYAGVPTAVAGALAAAGVGALGAGAYLAVRARRHER